MFEGFNETDSGLFYKLDVIGDGTMAVSEGDYVTISYNVELDNKDKVISSRLLFRLRELTKDGGVAEALSLMNLGDSSSFFFDTKTFYQQFMQENIPAKLKNEKLIRVGFKLEQLQNEKEFKENKHAFMRWLVQNHTEDATFVKEQISIEKYIESQQESYSITPTGLYYTELKRGKGDNADYGQSVVIHYEGFTLDGNKFDSSRERGSYFDFILGQEGQTIQGIEEGLFLMNTKSNYRFIIPSYLAFGESGSINKKVAPNSPVIYDVELVMKK
jgi:FKBP-type peptidyl-prolyl cis-trans isomerase FkpA